MVSDKKYYNNTITETAQALETTLEHGLENAQVAQRQQVYGWNKLQAEEHKSVFRMFLGHLNDPLIYVLLAAVAITMAMGEFIDGIIILIVVLLNSILGVVQELKADSALAALQQLATPKALVRRNGQVIEVSSEALVPGDIVILDAGRYVPADIRLTVAANLKVDESALTGESVSVEKDADTVLAQQEVSIGDRINMAYMSTLVTYGRGEGIVVNIGHGTEVGKIANIIKNELKVATPLEMRLAALGKTLGKLAVAICVVMFVIGWLQGRDLATMFMTAVSLAVASIPEGLAAIVAIVLSIGVTKMAKQKAIIKKLPAVETLGAVDIVCSDKTGTLTQNQMTVTQVFTFTDQLVDIKKGVQVEDSTKWLATAMVLNSDATLVDQEATGDPTEIALLRLADDIGLNRDQLHQSYPRINELAFDSNRKMMSTVHQHQDECFVFTKGAIDNLILKCTAVLEDGAIIPITEAHIVVITAAASRMSQLALRTLAVAYKPAQSDIAADAMEQELILIGVVGMIDPPRPEVKVSIAEAKAAGITTIMITGDHKDTALAIAKELGIASHANQAITGVEIDQLSSATFESSIDQYRVFARVSPEHKVNIVKAFKQKGHIVSMTGDGVNDAPSLNAADIGVAMGITGTDVAKNASSMILADDNFSTIIAAIEQGRNIYNNIKKSVIFLLSSNVGEVIAMLIAILAGAPMPLIATQLLWINLVTDSLPAIALGMDPGSKDVMLAKPRSASEGFFAHGASLSIIIGGVTIGLVTIVAFYLGFEHNGVSMFDEVIAPEALAYARTMAFMTIIAAQLFFSFTFNQSHHSIFSKGIFRNPYLWGAIIVGLSLQLIVLEVPFLTQAFQLSSLPLSSWNEIIFLGLVPLAVHEVFKRIKK